MATSARATKATKEDTVAELVDKYKQMVVKPGHNTTEPLCLQAGTQITTFYNDYENQPDDFIKTSIYKLTLPEIIKLQKEVTSSNGEATRIKAVSKALFLDIMTQIVHKQDIVATAKFAIDEGVSVAFHHDYMNENGGYEWAKLRAVLQKAIQDKAEEKGKTEGLAQSSN